MVQAFMYARIERLEGNKGKGWLTSWSVLRSSAYLGIRTAPALWSRGEREALRERAMCLEGAVTRDMLAAELM